MKKWFARLPIHRKLTALAVAVSTAALTAAVLSLLAFDVVRFRRAAFDDAHAMAEVIAQNAAAVLVFDDVSGAGAMLASLQVRPLVSRACAYRDNGTLLAGYERSARCPDTPADARGWRATAAAVPVIRNSHWVGTIYVERQLSDLPTRLLVTASAAAVTLAIAAALAFSLARRFQRAISRPIVALAAAARGIGDSERFAMPAIDAPPDETGQLVEAFSEMVTRMVSSHAALRAEIDERRRMQAEREVLLQREQEASRLKDEFLAAISHELRTPLNAILGWTQVLIDTKPGPETTANAIASLARNAQAQHRVIQDLLDISRIVTGKLQLNMAAFDLRAAVERACEVIEPLATAKQIACQVRLPAEPCLVLADFDRTLQILWNLLSNAVKFTPAGGTIAITLAPSETLATMTIEDTGIGIAPNFLPHVFERFRQADGSITREHTGLGLGLAIVKDLTEAQGGSVGATSQGVGHGSTFTVTLPRLAAASPAAGVQTTDRAGVPRLDRVEVLAIDDSPDALQILTLALCHAGARVRTARSATEALDDLRRALPSIVLCDLAMPNLDGFALLERIRTLPHDGAGTLPVLAVTAHASPADRERCLRAGFCDHIGKPYDLADLVRRIAAATVPVRRPTTPPE